MRAPHSLSILLALGCATPPASTPGRTTPVAVELRGTSWRLTDLAGAGALENVEATLEFPEAGRVSGKASCNRFFGTVEISGTSIRFGPLAATKMSCGDAADAQEVSYLAALQSAERFTFDGTELDLHSKGAEKSLRFVRR